MCGLPPVIGRTVFKASIFAGLFSKSDEILFSIFIASSRCFVAVDKEDLKIAPDFEREGGGSNSSAREVFEEIEFDIDSWSVAKRLGGSGICIGDGGDTVGLEGEEEL